MERQPYPTDLTDEQWERIRPLVEQVPGRAGRPRHHPTREVVNALVYLARSGCAWRLLPHDLPNHEIVRYHYDRWRRNGTLARLHDHLHQEAPVEAGRDPAPSAAIIDSQSVKTTEKGGSGVTTPGRK